MLANIYDDELYQNFKFLFPLFASYDNGIYCYHMMMEYIVIT